MVSSTSSSPNRASPGYLNTQEKEDSDLNSYLMMMIEDFKKSINNSLKEIQNTGKHPVSLNEGTQKSLNDFLRKTNKRGK